MRCPTCETAFCTKCNARPYHLGMDCATAKLQACAPSCRFCEAEIFVGSLDTVVVHARKVKCSLEVPLPEDSDEEEIAAALADEIDQERKARLARSGEGKFESKYDGDCEGDGNGNGVDDAVPLSSASPFLFPTSTASAMGVGLSFVDGNRIKILADRKRRGKRRVWGLESKDEGDDGEELEADQEDEGKEQEEDLEDKERNKNSASEELALISGTPGLQEESSDSSIYLCRSRSCRRKLPRVGFQLYGRAEKIRNSRAIPSSNLASTGVPPNARLWAPLLRRPRRGAG